MCDYTVQMSSLLFGSACYSFVSNKNLEKIINNEKVAIIMIVQLCIALLPECTP